VKETKKKPHFFSCKAAYFIPFNNKNMMIIVKRNSICFQTGQFYQMNIILAVINKPLFH